MHFPAHLPHFGVHPFSAHPTVGPTTMAKASTSFLTDEDLASAAFPDLHPVPSTSSDTLCDVDASGTGRPRRVSFCPLALLYTCAPDGEKDEVLASRDRKSVV